MELLEVNWFSLSFKYKWINYFIFVFFILGRDNIVELLIQKGVDINRKDASGLSPLYLAIERGYLIYNLFNLDASSIQLLYFSFHRKW